MIIPDKAIQRIFDENKSSDPAHIKKIIDGAASVYKEIKGIESESSLLKHEHELKQEKLIERTVVARLACLHIFEIYTGWADLDDYAVCLICGHIK